MPPASALASRLAPLESWAPSIAGALLATPVLLFRYPPMGDLAPHEAMVFVLRHLHDTRFFPPGLYATSLGHPNQLFHLLAWLLSLALPTDSACKLVVAGAVFLTPIAAAHLADHLKITRWTSLLVAPLAVGWLFRWGLTANLIGLVVFLWALPGLDRLARDPTPRRALAASLCVTLLYLAHESQMVCYAVASAVLAVQTPRRVRAYALVACPGALAVVLAAAYAVRAEPLKAASVLAIQDVSTPLLAKIAHLPGTLVDAGPVGLAVFAAGAVAAGLLACERFARTGAPRRTSLVWAADSRFVLLAVVLFALYLAMPATFSGSTLVYQRFAAPAFAVAALAAAPRGSRAPRWAPALVALPIASLAAILPSFIEQDFVYRALDRVLAKMDDGAAVAQLDLTPRAPGPVAPVVGAASRVLAVHGGRLLFSFSDAPYLPVTMPRAVRWDEPVLRMVSTPYAFMPPHDLTRFRYVLVYEASVASTARRRPTVGTKMGPAIALSFAPEAHLVAEEGPWMLFESDLPVAPLTAPDVPLPSPAPESLSERVRRLLGQATE